MQCMWRFPEIGVPTVIIHLNGILHYKPSICGYPHDYGNPDIYNTYNMYIYIYIRRPQQTAGGARPRRNVVARSLAATVFWCCEQVAAGLANSKVWSSFLWISCGA